MHAFKERAGRLFFPGISYFIVGSIVFSIELKKTTSPEPDFNLEMEFPMDEIST